nr:Uncharacterised protein [Klebsiella pneumoniae]
MSDRMFSELDQVFQDILDGVSPAGAPVLRAKLVWHCAVVNNAASHHRKPGRQALHGTPPQSLPHPAGSSSSGIMRSGR